MLRNASQNSVLRGQKNLPEPCLLTWYDPALGGINTTGAANPHAATASGEPYDPNALTCAAPPAYPFGTVITFIYNGKQVSCKVNDRGGAITGSHFDLSRAAANALGIISAGSANAQFFVGGIAGTPDRSTTAANAAAASTSSPDKGAVLSFGSLFSLAASDVAEFVFDAFIKFPVLLVGDYVIVPWWHWNQRAVVVYQDAMLADKTGVSLLTTLVFWGAGYGLLWGNPDARNVKDFFRRGLKPHQTMLARHVRTAQAIPAKRKLLKPSEVKKATAQKPKPMFSAALVEQVGTMSTTRPHRVQVHGYRADLRNQIADERVTTAKTINLRDRTATATTAPRTGESDASNRTGVGSHEAGGGRPKVSLREGQPRRRGVPTR